MVTITDSCTKRNCFWTDFKAFQSLKSFSIQYEETTDTYNIWGYDFPDAFICTIWKGDITPSDIYTQVQNDLDKTDFETNFKETANNTIANKINIETNITDPLPISITTGDLQKNASAAFTNSIKTLTLDVAGSETVYIYVNGTWTGSINIYGSFDGSTFTSGLVQCLDLGLLDGNIYTVITSPGNSNFLQGSVSGLKTIRFNAAVVSGIANIKVGCSTGTTVLTGVLGNIFSSQAGTWDINNISGTISLPTNASTTAKQDTGNTSLSSIDGKLTTTNSDLSTINTSLGTINTSIGTLDTDLKALQVAQGSTTSGQNGDLIQGAVTTNAPTYSTTKTDPLSLDTSGNLRVSLKDSPQNTNKFLVTADAVTFASPQHIIADASSAVIGHVINDASSAVIGHVIVDTAPSTAVTNAGTFAVQATIAASATNIAKAEDVASADADVGVPAMAIRKATPANTSGSDGDYEMLQMSAGRLWASATIDTALPAGSNVIGHVINDAGSALIGKVGIDQTTPGTTNLVALAANQSVNNAQINGVTPLMGNGGTGTGSQRVTIASDNTAFSVNATLSAETTKVIGTVNQGTSPWVDNITQLGGVSIALNSGAAGTGTLRVVQANESAISIGTSTGKAIIGQAGSLVSTAVTADQVIKSYTVTAGKTFYLTGFDCVVRLTTFATTATNFGNFSLETPSGTKIYTSNIFHAGQCSPVQMTFSEPIPIAAAAVVRLVCTPSATTSFTWFGNIMGYEK